jgi:PAS domain S-box-containing protein
MRPRPETSISVDNPSGVTHSVSSTYRHRHAGLRRDAAVLGFGLTLATLVAGAVLATLNVQRLTANERQVAHTQAVVGELEAVLSVLKDAETGQRGYLLTGDHAYLQPYQAALVQAPAALSRLQSLTSESPVQHGRLVTLTRTVAAKIAELRRTVALARAGDRAGALAIVRKNSGKALMDGARDTVVSMQATERNLLRRRAAEAEARFRVTVLSILLSALTGISLLGLVFALQRRNALARRRDAEIQAERGRLIALRADVSSALASVAPTPAILQLCCENLVQHLGMAFARIWTLAEAGDVLELNASAGIYTHLDGPHSRVPVGDYKIGRIASSRQPHLTNGVPDDPNVSDRDWARREGMVAFAGYPLLVEGRLLGVMAMFARHPLTAATVTDLAPLAEAIAQFIDRREAEERARQQAELNRVTLASIGDAVLTTDDQGRVTFLNDVAVEITGWTREDAAGQPVDAVFNIVNESTGVRVESPVDKVLRSGAIVGLANHTVLIARDGTRRPIDDSGAPIRSAGGEIVGVVLVFRDITEKHDAELASRRAEAGRQKFVSLAENSSDFIGMADLDGTVVYLNRAGMEMVGLESREEVLRTRREDYFFPEDLPKVRELLPTVMEKGHGQLEIRFRHFQTGEALWVMYNVSVLTDAEGNRVGLGTVTRNITERRKLEDNLRQLAADLSETDRRKDEFLATLAHELRNPLAPIGNGLQILKMAGQDGELLERARTMMERQLSQMVRLVDDLLDVSRISRNKLDLRKERVELAQVVGSAVETSRPLIEANGHELTVSLPEEPIHLDADLTRLAQVLSNLLNNAAKYTDRGGHLRLAAERQGDEVLVTVKDDGLGIPPAMLSRIFDLFTQVDRSLERAQGGLGIGLTLVKRLVEMHKGSVTAHSGGLGHGTEIAVRLPVLAEALKPELPDTALEPAPALPYRVLVVDDNRDSALTLSMLLELKGCETQTAHDGMDAVAKAAAYKPDVVLLDIGLPRLNGYEACRAIREQPGGKTILIVALTGWGQDQDRRNSKEAGFDGHLVKPVDHAELMKLLATSGRGAPVAGGPLGGPPA